MVVILEAVAMTATDSAYAFQPSHMQLQRHFNSNQTVAELTRLYLTLLVFCVFPRVKQRPTSASRKDEEPGCERSIWDQKRARYTNHRRRIAKCTSGHSKCDPNLHRQKTLIRLKLPTWKSCNELPDHSRTADEIGCITNSEQPTHAHQH